MYRSEDGKQEAKGTGRKIFGRLDGGAADTTVKGQTQLTDRRDTWVTQNAFTNWNDGIGIKLLA